MFRLLVALSVCLIPAVCFAQETTLSEVQLKKLKSFRSAYENLDALEDGPLRNQSRESLLLAAGEIVGDNQLTYSGLVELTTVPSSPWDTAKGFITFTNIIAVTAALLLVASLAWLTHLYLLAIIMSIPPKVHEFLIYLVCALLIVNGKFVHPEFQMLLVLPGCLGLIGGLAYTNWLRFNDKKFNRSVYFWFLTVVWAPIAIYYQSQVVGFMSCMSLLAALGFMAGMIPGVIWVGFDEDEVIPRCTIAGFIMLAIHVIMEICDPQRLTVPQYNYFASGFAFMGSFVYFLGLICLSWRGYTGWGRSKSTDWGKWLFYNVVAVASGVGALYLGSTFGLGTMLGVCGTFFYIYLIEKYYELPWEGKGWAWSMLGLAAILYGFVVFAKSNPHLFLFM